MIAERAKAKGAAIHWCEEIDRRSHYMRGRNDALKGQTQVIRFYTRREGLSIISTVTNHWVVRWKVFDGAPNANLLIDVFERLIPEADHKIFLILETPQVCRRKLAKAQLTKHPAQIEVSYFLSYSTKLNPNETLNADHKQAVTPEPPARTKGALRKDTINHLCRFYKSPTCVTEYVLHRPVRYAVPLNYLKTGSIAMQARDYIALRSYTAPLLLMLWIGYEVIKYFVISCQRECRHLLLRS